jgi:radical SAM superfamily enzyme YgiQ (UPF0313 family)
MKKPIILFQPKFWPGPLRNRKPQRKKYYHGVRETFRYFPLGLLSIATVLKDSYDVTIIDQRFDRDWRQTVKGLMSDSRPLFVGVTACTGYEIKGGLEFSRRVRELDPDVPVVWGGWHASTVPEETVASPSVDIVVRGQGEWTALELAERLSAGSRDYSGIAGLTYIREDGTVVSGEDRKVVKAEKLPEIDYSFVEPLRYLRFKDGSKARLFYVSSIGCPYYCTFCSIAAVYKRHWSSKEPSRVVREIRYFVDNFDIDTVEFDGTIFFANVRWAKQVLKALIESGMDLSYVTSTRADIIVHWDQEMKELVARAGFKAIGVGAESGSERVLEIIDKRITVEDIVGSLKVLKSLGVDPAYTFMFGIPGETREDAGRSLELMLRLKKIMPECRLAGFFYHPFPGSELYSEYKRMYNVREMTLEEWADYSFDLKHPASLALNEKFIDFINERIQYLDWAYPEDDSKGGFVRWLRTRICRQRVDRGYYGFPWEWKLAKALGKSSRLRDSQSL